MIYKDKDGNIKYDHRKNTKEITMCLICGKQVGSELHHLCCGRADRKKSDKYGLVAMLCRQCHHDIHNKHKNYEELEELAERMWLKYIGDFKSWFNTFHINRCVEIKFDKYGNEIKE